MGLKGGKIPGRKKGKSEDGAKVLATMTEDERKQMFDLQFRWEDLVEQAQSADRSLTGYRQFIRNRYDLPRVFTIDLATGVITEAPEPAEAVNGSEEA